MSERDDFSSFVAASSRALLRAGWLLAGDWPAAEDLVQAALLATWRRWAEAGAIENPYAYVRRVMVTTYLRSSKRRWHGEFASGSFDDLSVEDRRLDAVDMHRDIAAALATLPPKQRAIVVMRYFADLTEAQTAEVVGCRVGTVKSQLAKAFVNLRAVPGLADVMTGGRMS